MWWWSHSPMGIPICQKKKFKRTLDSPWAIQSSDWFLKLYLISSLVYNNNFPLTFFLCTFFTRSTRHNHFIQPNNSTFRPFPCFTGKALSNLTAIPDITLLHSFLPPHSNYKSLRSTSLLPSNENNSWLIVLGWHNGLVYTAGGLSRPQIPTCAEPGWDW